MSVGYFYYNIKEFWLKGDASMRKGSSRLGEQNSSERRPILETFTFTNATISISNARLVPLVMG
jgi:hypothetical protein